MRAETGTCKWCGQVRTVMVPEDKELTREGLDRIASAECDCEGAATERRVKEVSLQARRSIETLLEDQQTPAAILRQGVDGVARGKIKKISVNVDGYITCSMWKGKTGSLVIEKREITVEQSEGDEE